MSAPVCTRVYTADTSPLRNGVLFEEAYRRVSERRRRKTDRLRFQKDKCLSVGAELLLMQACRNFGVDYDKARILAEDGMKPVFASGGFSFNLSHSEERVMCVFSVFPAGCDVEKKHPVDLELARRFFFRDEYRSIEDCETQEEREEMFFRLWTLKESFMKCTGLGFRLPLDAFSVSAGEKEIRVTQSVDAGDYRFTEMDLRDGYRYAWCVRAPDRETPSASVLWKPIDFSEVICHEL